MKIQGEDNEATDATKMLYRFMPTTEEELEACLEPIAKSQQFT